MFAKFGFYLNYHFSTVLHWERNCKSDKARITTSVLPGKSQRLITRIAMMVKLTKGRTSKTTLRILLLLLCSKFVLQSWGSLVPIHQICNFFWHQHWMSRIYISCSSSFVRLSRYSNISSPSSVSSVFFIFFFTPPPIPVTPAIPGTHSSCFPPAAITYILLFNPRWAQFEHFTKTKKWTIVHFFCFGGEFVFVFDIQAHDSLLIYHVIVSFSISFLSCGFNMEFYFHLAWRPLRGPLARPLAQMGWFGLTGRTTSWLNRTHRNA